MDPKKVDEKAMYLAAFLFIFLVTLGSFFAYHAIQKADEVILVRGTLDDMKERINLKIGEIDSLNIVIDHLSDDLALYQPFKAKYELIKEELDSLRTVVLKTRQELDGSSLALIKILKDQISQYDEVIDKYEKKLNELEQKLWDTDTDRFDVLTENIEGLNNEKNYWLNRSDSLLTLSDSLYSSIVRLNRELKDKDVIIAQKDMIIAHKDQVIDFLKDSVKSLTTKIKQLNDESAQNKQKINRLLNKMDDLTTSQDSVELAYDSLLVVNDRFDYIVDSLNTDLVEVEKERDRFAQNSLACKYTYKEGNNSKEHTTLLDNRGVHKRRHIKDIDISFRVTPSMLEDCNSDKLIVKLFKWEGGQKISVRTKAIVGYGNIVNTRIDNTRLDKGNYIVIVTCDEKNIFTKNYLFKVS